MPRRIVKIHGVPVDVAVQVPRLRIRRVGDHIVRLHEPAHCAGVVSKMHVIHAGPCIPFLAGVLVLVFGEVAAEGFKLGAEGLVIMR